MADVSFTTMVAMSRLYEHNMKVLHWGAAGRKFDRIHSLCDEYEEMFHSAVDFAAETGLRINQIPPAFDHIVEILDQVDHDFVICPYKTVGYDEAMEQIGKMLTDMLWILGDLHEQSWMEEPINMGIKAEVESLFNQFDFQARYLHARRTKQEEN